MANYKVKKFKYYLSKDKKFMEKLNQCQDDLKAGRVGFFVSMQTLIGYTSFKFLNSLIIEDKNLKSKFFKMNSMTGDINSLEALKLLCRVLNRMDLFNLIEETGLNDYANVDKHSKIYVPFDGDVANNSALAFNQYINSLMTINRFVDANNCKIKNFYTTKVEPVKQPIIKEEEIDPKLLRKEKFESLVKDEHYIANSDFYLGNSKWNIRILDFKCKYEKCGLFSLIFNPEKGVCKINCVLRLTLLDRNDELNSNLDITVTMKSYTSKTFEFKEAYQSERFSLCDEVNLDGKTIDKVFKFCVENEEIDEKFNFTYNIKKNTFIFD